MADDQEDEREEDRQRVQRRPEVRLAVRAGEVEQGERQHEEAMDHPEDAVMHDEERDQGGLAGAARRAAVDLEAVEPTPGVGRRHRRFVLRPLGLAHLEDVEQPVDAVLQPVDDEDPPDIPAEPEDAGERNEVGKDQGDDGPVRGPDLVPGDEALHAPDASGSARPNALGRQFDRRDRDGVRFAGALDAEVDRAAR